MNFKIIMGAATLLAVAVVAWLVLGKESAIAPAQTNDDEARAVETGEIKEVDQDNTFAGAGSFLSLMALGRDLTCDFSYVAPDTNGAVAGTVFISGERMRGDFEMEQSGEVMQSHMIQDDEYMYTWSQGSMGSFAMKMPLDEAETTGAQTDVTSESYSRPVALDYDVNYSCQPWSVSAATFVPPADIDFMTMEEMMRGFNPNLFTQ